MGNTALTTPDIIGLLKIVWTADTDATNTLHTIDTLEKQIVRKKLRNDRRRFRVTEPVHCAPDLNPKAKYILRVERKDKQISRKSREAEAREAEAMEPLKP
jgi:hypothetical protein